MPDIDKRKVTISARETIRVVNDRESLFLCVEINNYRFVQRAVYPVVRLEEQPALFTIISEDETTLYAYFPVKVPLKGKLYFGYMGEEPELVLSYDFEKRKPELLDRKKLSKKVVEVTDKTFTAKR